MEEWQQHLLNKVVLAATVEILRQQLPPLLFGLAERPVRIRREHRHGLGSDMAEVAVAVLAVERLETLAAKNLVELRQRARTIRTLVVTVGWAHELVNETAEDLWRARRTVMGPGQHLLQHVRNPSDGGSSRRAGTRSPTLGRTR